MLKVKWVLYDFIYPINSLYRCIDLIMDDRIIIEEGGEFVELSSGDR